MLQCESKYDSEFKDHPVVISFRHAWDIDPQKKIPAKYMVFHFEVNISAPRLNLGSKSQQILTLAWARSIWDFQPLGAKARAMPVEFSDALDVKPVH
jgi:hypothetical protein